MPVGRVGLLPVGFVALLGAFVKADAATALTGAGVLGFDSNLDVYRCYASRCCFAVFWFRHNTSLSFRTVKMKLTGSKQKGYLKKG